MSMHATIFTWDEVLPCFWLMAPVGGGIAGLGLPVSSMVVRKLCIHGRMVPVSYVYLHGSMIVGPAGGTKR